MDDDYGQTQALTFDDSGDETDEELEGEKPPVGSLKFLCQKGHPEKSFPLYEGDSVIGRHESCNITIPLTALSREHACIEVRGQSVLVYDKGSKNRTKRNKHFLQPEVRYELRDKDKLIFGDVECVFEAEQKEYGAIDSGSETGSESMFETAPIDEVLDEKVDNTFKLPAETDYQSDASSDILEPTQAFGSQKQQTILKNNNSTLTDQNKTHNITVKDTPAPPRSKRITENLVLPESGSETDEDESIAAPTLAIESQHSDEDESPKRSLLGAPTQAYVCESDDETEEEVTPKKKSLLMAATQAYVEEDEDGETPRKKSILTAATQAYVEESDETGDEEETPVKAKRNIIAEPTQAYTMAPGIEPTQAYNMDEDSNDESKDAETPALKKSLLFESTQAYTGDAEEEDHNEDEVTENKKSVMYEPTQAYPGKTGQDDDKDGAASDTSEEFVLDENDDDDDDKDNGEDVSHIFMAPTLACDNGEDSNQTESSGDGIQEMETQAVVEDQTQVVDETGDKDKADDATQVFNDDATQPIRDKSKPKKASQVDNDAETQVVSDETQVIDEDKGTANRKETADEPTQMVFEETQVVDKSQNQCKGVKGKRTSEDATQVFTDDTLAVEEMAKEQGDKKSRTDETDTDSEQPTQVFPDATMAVEDLYHQNKVKKKDKTEDASEAATQVFEETAEVKEAKGTKGKGKRKAKVVHDSEEATQVFDDESETTSVAKQTKYKKTAGQKANEEETQMFTQGIEEDDSQKELIIRAVATLAAEDNDETDVCSAVTEKNEGLGSEAATQVFDGTVAVSEMETLPNTGGDASDTLAITDAETVSVAEPEPTLPVHEVIEKTKPKGRGRKGGKANAESKTEDATQVFDSTETLPIVETEEKAKPKGRGKKAGKSKVTVLKQNPETDDATQSLDTAETLAVSEIEEELPKRTGRKRGAVQDKVPETQVDKTVEHPKDEADKKVIESAEPVEKQQSRRSARQGKKKETDQETKEASHSRKQESPQIGAKTNEAEIADQPGGRKSRSRKGKQTVIYKPNEIEGKTVPVPKTGKRKGKAEQAHEEATQAYVEEEPSQRYGDRDDEHKGSAIEDDDLTPPLSEEMVPDSEDTMTSPIIPAPPLVRIPSRSPHKSALASPGKKKSPSPKRVQFVSQGSDETEPTVVRGRRGRKIVMKETEDETDDKKQAETEEKPVGRRGRRSVEVQPKTVVESKGKTGRKSLPAVLEVDSSKDSLSVSQELDQGTVADEIKVLKGRKARNAKKVQTHSKDSEEGSVTLKRDSVIEKEGQPGETENKKVSKRSTRGKVANEDSVPDKKDEEIPQPSTEVSRGSKRQSSRSKNRDKAVVETVNNEATGNRNKTSEIAEEKSDKTEETSHRTRNKTKTDSQDSDTVTGKRGTRKTAIHESDNSELKSTDKVTVNNKNLTTKQLGKGSKHKEKGDNTELDELVVKNDSASELTEPSDKQSVRSSRRKGKAVDSQDSQTNETKKTITSQNKAETSIKVEDKVTKASKRKGKADSQTSQSEEQKSETTSKGDLKEITNLKNNVQHGKNLKDTKSDKTIGKAAKNSIVLESGKVTRGKIAGPASGSGDAQQGEMEQTPAKRRKTTIPESKTNTSVTQKTTNRRATVAGVATPPRTAGKAPVGTPKGTSKKGDDIPSSPSLRKTDHSKPKVMFTGVTDEQSEKIVKELGGEMATSVYHCTHLVTDQVRRTVKFLCCLSRGIPICTPQWLMSSKRTSVFSDPSPFLISDHTSEKKFKFSLQLSLDKASEKLFLSDYKIHVTKSVKPEPNQMKDIIQCAGAKYLASMPKTYSDQTVVVSCEEDKAACDGAIKAGIPVVGSEFILTGALRQEADINSYPLYNPV